jgi:Beta/Gamma crystallin
MQKRRFIAHSAIILVSLALSGTVANSAKIATQKGMLTLYAGQKFTGDYLEVTKDRPSISTDFTIGSVAVFEGEKWELCEGQRYKEPCIIFSSNETDMGQAMIRSARKVKVEPAA